MEKIDASKYFGSLKKDKKFLGILFEGVSEEMQKASRKSACMQQEARKAAAEAVLNC